MKHAYHNFLLPLKTGTRLMIFFMSLLYIAALVGKLTAKYNFFEWSGLRSTSVWHGEVWRLLSYAFVTPNLFNFVINVAMLAMLGAFLERVWSAKEFWIFCLISAAGAGIAKVLVTPASPVLIVANVPILFGLLVAWAKTFGNERVYFMGIWEMSVRVCALIFALISILAMLPCAGILNTLIMLCGGAAGWIYLFLRSRSVHSQQSKVVGSVRMGRLEL
jgi:membrane associated rhomboid family serine protease